MRAIKMKALVDENSTIVINVPKTVPNGPVEVIILVDEKDELVSSSQPDSADSFTELMEFHKKHRLDGVSLRELKEEGRR